MKALIADDSATMRKIITGHFKNSGRENYAEAENGLKAWKIVNEDPEIGLVLLDLNMPELDGFGFLTRIKAHPVYKNIPIVVITTQSERGQVLKAIKLGVDGYLIKPVTLENLQKSVFPLLK